MTTDSQPTAHDRLAFPGFWDERRQVAQMEYPEGTSVEVAEALNTWAADTSIESLYLIPMNDRFYPVAFDPWLEGISGVPPVALAIALARKAVTLENVQLGDNEERRYRHTFFTRFEQVEWARKVYKATLDESSGYSQKIAGLEAQLLESQAKVRSLGDELYKERRVMGMIGESIRDAANYARLCSDYDDAIEEIRTADGAWATEGRNRFVAAAERVERDVAVEISFEARFSNLNSSIPTFRVWGKLATGCNFDKDGNPDYEYDDIRDAVVEEWPNADVEDVRVTGVERV